MFIDHRPQPTKLTITLLNVSLELPISPDRKVTVQGKFAKLPKEYFSKDNQPIVNGCSVRVNYINDEAET